MRQSLLDAGKDLLRGGPGFLFGGIEARLGRKRERSMVVAGTRLHFRPRASDFEVCRQVFRDQQYRIHPPAHSARIAQMYAAILTSGKTPVIVDAGANIGASAIWFGQEYPRAAIVAIEPDADNARLARRNLAGQDTIQLLEAAIGNREGFVSVLPGEQPWTATTRRSDAGCPVVTIASALGLIENGQLFIVKIDIEGFEDDLFEANTEWLDTVCVVFIEPHDWMFPERGTSRNFQAEIGRRDFDLLINGENLIYVRREGPQG